MKLLVILGLCLSLEVSGINAAATWWQAHASKFTCERPGYFVNPADCHNFYRCVDRSAWNKPALQRYDFTCPNGMIFDPAVSVCTHPGPNGCAEPWWPSNNSGGDKKPPSGNIGGGGRPSVPESPDPDDDGNSLESLPSIFDSSKGPGDKRPTSGSGFNRPSGGSDVPWFEKPSSNAGGGGEDELDLLDLEFDSLPDPANAGGGGQNRPESSSTRRPLNSGGSRPSNPFSPGKPGGPFGSGRGGAGADPLDDLDSPLGPDNSGGENLDSSTPSFGTQGKCDRLLGCSNEDRRNSKESSPSSSSSRPSGSWGSSESTSQSPNSFGTRPISRRPNPPSNTGFNRPGSEWDRNDDDIDLDLDGWNSNELGQGGNSNRPSNNNNGNANWGGSQRPTTSPTTERPNWFDHSPWRPSGPLGSGGNDLSPRPGNNQWFDVPHGAIPLRPGDPSIPISPVAVSPRPANPRITAPPPPPPEVWANPFRPRFPLYQVVAYPTWPGPMDRRPIIVVYSNSRK